MRKEKIGEIINNVYIRIIVYVHYFLLKNPQ